MGTHEVKINGGAERIECPVPAIVDPALREKALRRLEENKRFAGSRPHRNYLLSGPVECAHCGWTYRGTCASGSRTGKRYYYYGCGRRGATYDKRVERSCPNVNAEWLEDLVRQDVSSFLENPGEVLERVREQVEDDDQANELEERRESLEKRPARKQAERDRATRLYRRGLISEEEADVLLADLNNQTANLRLLIESVESDLSKREESKLAAMTTEAWRMDLRKNLAEVEEEITVDRDDYGRAKVDITYRFGPPEPPLEADCLVGVQDIRQRSLANRA